MCFKRILPASNVGGGRVKKLHVCCGIPNLNLHLPRLHPGKGDDPTYAQQKNTDGYLVTAQVK